MPKIVGWQCAECGVIKKESNRWFWIGTHPSSIRIMSFEDRNLDQEGDAYCGRNCIIRAVESFMEKTEK